MMILSKEDSEAPELLIGGKSFLGHKQARNLLSRGISSNRLAHAYLFRGPEGIGKQLFARGLTAAVNCAAAKGIAACGICSGCRKFASGAHPDFLLVSPEKGAIKIDQVRELIKKLSYAPYEAETRVVLIEDVHTMRREAANSLLKTLEEPPEDNLLILTADSSGSILPTISSRCQTIPFYPLTLEETVEIILREDRELDQETATLLARLAEGSPGRALLLHRKDLVGFGKRVVDLISDPDKRGGQHVGLFLQTAETMAGLKTDLSYLLGLLRLWIRDGLFSHYCQEAPTAIMGIRKDWSSEQYFAKLQAIDRAENELNRNCNRTLVCEVLLFELQA
ncbi:MAG: DNA polymerase III subunit delta' [Proteobacteria bacterium]|nr:DNA polymerase III subunit delta' [Pseudomonadota bacterium]MBU1140310.1 DNA polymerase III subunit delta' [Pseudomonadota bacterium]